MLTTSVKLKTGGHFMWRSLAAEGGNSSSKSVSAAWFYGRPTDRPGVMIYLCIKRLATNFENDF